MRRLLARIAYILLILLMATTAKLLILDHQETEVFQQARLSLLERRYREAEERFATLQTSWFWKAEARTGRLLSRALQGNQGTVPERLTDQETSPFPIELLLSQSFTNGNFDGCLQLARLTVGHPSSRLFEVASLLEQGKTDAARELWRGIESAPSRHWLAPRLREALALSISETTRLIRDRKGRLLAWRDGRQQIYPLFGNQPQWLKLLARMEPDPSAGSLRSGLDVDLMGVAARALEGYRGTIVLLEPTSGELLAAWSDELTAREGIPALEQRREPASIAKLITTSAALRAQLDPDRFLQQVDCGGARRYQGGILYCAYRAGPLRGLDRSMAISCNIGFADLAVQVGRPKVIDEFRRFGFDQGDFFGRIRVPAGDQRQLADLAIGLEATDITPLHAALLAATVANHGRMVEPRLVSARDGRLGFSPRFEPLAPGRRVLAEQDNLVLQKAMLAVVRQGTGFEIQVPGFPIAMKTGTGRDPGMGGYHINYIGFGPPARPTIAFAVRVTNQATSPRVRAAGIEVSRRLMQGLAELQRRGEWPYPPALPNSHPLIAATSFQTGQVPSKASSCPQASALPRGAATRSLAQLRASR